MKNRRAPAESKAETVLNLASRRRAEIRKFIFGGLVDVLTPALDQDDKHDREANPSNDANHFDVSHVNSPF
jgi:hypothetical protein